MSNNKGAYGRALFELLEAEWAAKRIKQNAWSDKYGFVNSTVTRWGTGSDPSLASLRPVADALGRPLMELLVAIGLISSDEAGGITVQPVHSCKVEDAIAIGEGLSDSEHEILKTVWRSIEMIRAGAEESKASTAKPPIKSTRRSRRQP